MNPETIRVLGWCLLHFVWQGAVLALLLSALLTRLRSPQARYAGAVAVLAQKFRLRLKEPQEVKLQTRITLRPKNKLMTILERRPISET